MMKGVSWVSLPDMRNIRADLPSITASPTLQFSSWLRRRLHGQFCIRGSISIFLFRRILYQTKITQTLHDT